MRIALLTTDNRQALEGSVPAHPCFGSAPSALLSGFVACPDVEVHVISCTRRRHPAPEKLAPNVWFHAVCVGKWGWLRTGYQGTIHAVRRVLNRIRPDVVHGQGTERDCALNAVFSGYPSVITVHGHMRRIAELVEASPISFYGLAARLESVALRRAGGVICLNEYTRESISALVKRTWIVPNAVDDSFFNLRRNLGGRPIILCIGNISPWKNQTWLIGALEGLNTAIPFELHFIGAADKARVYDSEFLDLINQRSWCVYHGGMTMEGIQSLLSSAHILVLPSKEENCPMVVLESMAAQVPVIAAAVGGVPELLGHGERGLLFRPGDRAELARILLHLLEYPDDTNEKVERARAWALEHAQPSIVARQHLAAYRELLTSAM